MAKPAVPQRPPQRPAQRVVRRTPARAAAESRADSVVCPRCGRCMAKVIGRSEVMPIVYLRCDGCHMPSVTGV